MALTWVNVTTPDTLSACMTATAEWTKFAYSGKVVNAAYIYLNTQIFIHQLRLSVFKQFNCQVCGGLFMWAANGCL